MRMSSALWIWCVCALLADLSCGDVDGTTDGQVADALTIVKGVVTDSLNGIALEGVAILKDGIVRAHSQANGQYEVGWFGDVHAWLRFEKPEYAPREVDVEREATHDSTVEWGYRLDVRMRRLSSGRPIVDVEVPEARGADGSVLDPRTNSLYAFSFRDGLLAVNLETGELRMNAPPEPLVEMQRSVSPREAERARRLFLRVRDELDR